MPNHIKKTAFAVLTGLAAIVAIAPAVAADAAWESKVKKLLAAKQVYPDAAQSKDDEGTAVLKISIASDGKLSAVELVKPSGSRVLDREAVTIPSKVGTFPAPGTNATITVPLTWKLA